MSGTLKAGAAAVDISPKDTQFLSGYPHVERYSIGLHDPLISSALYLNDGKMGVLFIANDIISIEKDIIKSARERISQAVGIRASHIMITATHTHSGPLTCELTAWKADGIIPSPDKNYLKLLEDGIVRSGVAACKNAQPAQVGLSLADGTGVGTNRHDPLGPSDPQVPVLIVKSADDKTNIACMLVFSMHPTVLHEDSKLVSADFPGMARQYLAENVLGKDCPIIYHMGAAGNQSPRYITKANTFDEARRLGNILGSAVEKVIPQISYTRNVLLSCVQEFIDLRMRDLPTVSIAQEKLNKANKKYQHLHKTGATSQEIRTAECDVFGAEGILNLAKISVKGGLEAQFAASMPYEIQMIMVGPWKFVGWSGELFVEYSLEVKAKVDNLFPITMANGTAPGYIATQKAFDASNYEAAGTLLPPETGQIIIDRTLYVFSRSKA